eukprot:4031995-Amphidinium_carterae.1
MALRPGYYAAELPAQPPYYQQQQTEAAIQQQTQAATRPEEQREVHVIQDERDAEHSAQDPQALPVAVPTLDTQTINSSTGTTSSSRSDSNNMSDEDWKDVTEKIYQTYLDEYDIDATTEDKEDINELIRRDRQRQPEDEEAKKELKTHRDEQNILDDILWTK